MTCNYEVMKYLRAELGWAGSVIEPIVQIGFRSTGLRMAGVGMDIEPVAICHRMTVESIPLVNSVQ